MNVERHNKGVVSWSLNEICRVVADHRLESKIPHVQEPDLLRASGALAHLREYILRYSKERDCVVDPFGGSGVTAIEALLENRAAIHNDINPLANFIAQGVAGLAEGTLTSYRDALERAKSACLPKLAEMEKATPSELNRLLSALPLPENVQLPATSNVENYRDLFTPRQLAALTILKVEVERIPDQAARNGMRLAWSATLAKLNKTFLSAKGRIASRGGSSIFSIYRYKVAKEPVGLPAWATFEERVQNVIAAKREIEHAIKLKEAGAAIPSGPCTRRKTANRYWPEK